MSYVPKVYKTSGGDTLNIASGGELQIAGTAFISSGGGVALGSLTSGAVTFASAVTFSAGMKESIQVMTSSAGTLTGYGVSVVRSTISAEIVHTITPSSGYVKYITCNAASGSTSCPIVTTTGTWDGTNKNAMFTTGNSNFQWLQAVGYSTALWYVIGCSTDVTFTNT